MLFLYHAPISTCSQKVRLVLAEKQLEWEGKSINFGKGEHLTPEYLRLNPNGVVPTLLHDDDPIIESSVITEYLDEVFPEHPVRPKDHKPLAHMRAWRQYIDEVPTPSIRPISFNTFFVLRKHFYRKMGRTGFSSQEIDESLDRLSQALGRMESALERTRFIAGDEYSIADVNMTPTVVRLEDCGRANLWDRLPRVADWYERIKARPNFDVAYMPGSRDLGAHI